MATGLGSYSGVAESIDLPSYRQEEHLPLLVREPNGSRVYLATTGSYYAPQYPNWQHPSFVIQPGTYDVTVAFAALGGRTDEATFQVMIGGDGDLSWRSRGATAMLMGPLVLSAFILLGVQSAAQVQEPNGWQQTKWGMTYDEVAKAMSEYSISPLSPAKPEPFPTSCVFQALLTGFTVADDKPSVKLCFDSARKLISVTLRFGPKAVCGQLRDALHV